MSARGWWGAALCALLVGGTARAAEPAGAAPAPAGSGPVPQEAPLPETRGVLEDLKAAGDIFVQELMRTFDQLILGAPAPADPRDGLATSYKGWLDDLECQLDPSAFHAPFSDSLVAKQFDIEINAPAAKAWLVRAETGLKVPVELHPSGDGSVGVAPALGPGMWALVAQDTAGHSRCILLRAKSASFSGPACAPGPTGTRGCEALELVMDRRYADLRGLGAELPASDTETRLILAAAACQQGHVPGDLIAGDIRDCASVYRALPPLNRDRLNRDAPRNGAPRT